MLGSSSCHQVSSVPCSTSRQILAVEFYPIKDARLHEKVKEKKTNEKSFKPIKIPYNILKLNHDLKNSITVGVVSENSAMVAV